MTRASTARLNRLRVGGLMAALLAVGCSADPALYLGGPAGPATQIQLSTSRFVLQAGVPAMVGAQPRDAVGNPTGDAVTFSSCNSAKVSTNAATATGQWSHTATVTGVALGESCVAVSAGSLTDTVRVAIGPASIVIAGPDTVPSGTQATYELEFYDAAGSPLTAGDDFPIPALVSLNSLRLPVSGVDDLNYAAAGQQPGSVRLQASTIADFGPVAGTKMVTIVPGPFGGTISATTAAVQGGPIKITRPSGVTWDGDETVSIGEKYLVDTWDGTAAGVASAAWYPDSIVFRVPAPLTAGVYDLFVLDQGPGQVASQLTFTVTGTFASNRQGFPGFSTPGTRLEDKPLPLRFPVVHSTTSATTYYTLTPATDFQFTAILNWEGDGAVQDLDIELIDGTFSYYLDWDLGGMTTANPEAVTWWVPAGDFGFVRVYNSFSGQVPAQFTLLEGCVEVLNGDGVSTADGDNWPNAGCE